jgi:integrase
MLNRAWVRARKRAGLTKVSKRTFGSWLRSAGVNFEDHQDLLGHRSGRITHHYSAAELSRLMEAADSVCDGGQGKPELVVLQRLSVS